MRNALFACFGALLVSLPAHGQLVVNEFDVNPAPSGSTVTFTITDAQGAGFQLPTSCGDIRIYQGSQTGPQVGHNMICGAVITPIAAGGSYSFSWTLNDFFGVPLPAGEYWWRSQVYDASFNSFVSWHCMTIEDFAPLPTISLGGTPMVGQSTPFDITDGPAGAFYFVGMSQTMNNPFSVPGPFVPSPLDLCLSFDVLFNISINAPGSIMTNSIGFLDAAGAASGSVDVPALATLAMQPFQLQAVLIDGGGWQTTNGLSSWIRP